MNDEKIKKINRREKETDPIRRFVEKESDKEFSPMNPPDPFNPPSLENVPFDDYHPFIQKFINEHKASLQVIENFEQNLKKIYDGGLNSTPDISKGLKMFFSFIDNKAVLHNLKEEKILFPLLQKRLLENGEHGKGKFPKTAVDNLEDDHIKLMQLTSVCFNFFALAARLTDAGSKAIVLDSALEQGKALIEFLRLHIFREDNVAFPLAKKYISFEEFEDMNSKISQYDDY